MATSTGHLSQAPVTHISVEKKEHKENLPECRTFKEPRGGWEGTNRRQPARASPCGDDSNEHVQGRRSPSGQQKSPSQL